MTPHTHTSFVEGCYRCDLSRDEATGHREVESVSGEVTCSCGWKSGHHSLASDADRAWIAHVEGPHSEDGCERVFTDCCDPMRWECETVVVLDDAGDVDVRVCRRGEGCQA